MACTPGQRCNVDDILGDRQGPSSKPLGFIFASLETQSDSCQSASNSTATPSETASSDGGASPRQTESVYHVEVRGGAEVVQARPELDDAPLGDMFEDSDGDVCPLSPSKSARRRMRRRRQRDAIRAAMRDTQHGEELRGGRKEDMRARSVVTLDDIGFELAGCNMT